MNMTLNLFLTFALAIGLTQLSIAGEVHNHEQHEAEQAHDHEEEGSTQISSLIAEQLDIRTTLSGPQAIHQTITTYGRLTTAPEQTSHVRARFAGVIKSVHVTLGDTVTTGDLLAVVESNESLKEYELRAPISGTIIQRHANKGEMTQAQVLFSIADFESLWAELRVFPSQQKTLSAGQRVAIIIDDHTIQSTILHLLPASVDAPYLIARTQLKQTQVDLFPGMMIEGQIVINEFEAPVAVVNTGLQTMARQSGVFIKHQNEFVFRPLILGRSDTLHTEVLSGLESGVEYVTTNSYLIKADIEKSEAEHEH